MISVRLLGLISLLWSLLFYKKLISIISFSEQYLFKKFPNTLSVTNEEWSLLKEEFNRSQFGKHFDCPDIKLPDYVQYVVAIGGLPGGGGRTVVTALQKVLNLNFGEEGQDIYGDSKDNKHFIHKYNPKGLMDLVVSHKRYKGAIGEEICDLLGVLGPIGTTPDNIKQGWRRKVCNVIKSIHLKFQIKNFPHGEKIWIFKYAESVMLVPLLARLYGDKFRFIFNVRHPSCHTGRNYNEHFKKGFACYHPVKNEIFDILEAIDLRIRTVKQQAPKWFVETDALKRSHIEALIKQSSNMTEALTKLQAINILSPGKSVEIYEFLQPLLVEEDILFSMTWREIVVPIFIYLKEDMAGRFAVVRHEDLLNADGLRSFVTNIKRLLCLVELNSIGRDELEAVADNFAAHSASCPRRILPNWTHKYIEGPLGLFNYTKC